MNLSWIKSMQRKNAVFLLTFVTISCISFLTLFIGNKYKFYFHQDMIDSFMDLFNSIAENRQRGGDIGNYPPMATLPYKVLARLVPWEMFDQSLRGRDLAFALRGSVPGTFILLLHIFCFVLPFIYICYHSLDNIKHVNGVYVAFLIFSGVMLYSLERGNIIIYAFLFTFLFVYLIEHCPKYKYLAYFCLALAASIKLYPAIFGLMILNKKNIKGCVICLVGFFVIYYIAYWLCGLQSPTTYLEKILAWAKAVTPQALGTNFSSKNFIFLANKFIYSLLGKGNGYFNVPGVVFVLTKIFVLLFGIVSYFYSNCQWKKLTSLSLMCILIPDVSYTYTLLFMLIPLVSFLNEINDERINIFYAVSFAIVVSVLVIPIDFALPVYTATFGFIIQFGTLLLIWTFISLEAIINFTNVQILRKNV